ncbi:MAG: lipoprotein-releasing system ATP-binding protein LolD [Gammaproteobacteria bacterium]|nr:MAG: lipoprotein-releasing system ATP-binding protein LolD [Gammaproteobacteria bacterium]
MPQNIIECKNLYKEFKQGNKIIKVLNDINLSVKAGEQIAIIGSSGVGKSTLLQLLGGLDDASAGEVIIYGSNLKNLNQKEKGDLRNKYLGFVYQFHHLLNEFTALENVAMPLLIAGHPPKHCKQKAKELLKQVFLADRVEHKPTQLSGGERQRVAIARALICRPACILADEATGNLDEKTALDIMELLFDLNKKHQTAGIFVTHDKNIACKMQRQLLIKNATLIEN